MDKLKFKSVNEAEKYLEGKYVNKIIELTYVGRNGLETVVGKVDRLSIDAATKNPPVIILFIDSKRIEVEKDDFFTNSKLLN